MRACSGLIGFGFRAQVQGFCQSTFALVLERFHTASLHVTMGPPHGLLLLGFYKRTVRLLMQFLQAVGV